MLNILKKAKELWSWYSFAVGVGALALSGVTVAVGGAVWLVSLGLPLPLVIMAAYCTIVGAVYLTLAPLIFRSLAATPKPVESTARPDYDAWRHVQLLRLDQAAALWCERDPHSKGVTPKEKTWFAVLKDAVQGGELTPTLADWADDFERKWARLNPTGDTTVRRSDLKKFATKRGYDPVFLRD